MILNDLLSNMGCLIKLILLLLLIESRTQTSTSVQNFRRKSAFTHNRFLLLKPLSIEFFIEFSLLDLLSHKNVILFWLWAWF